MRATDYRRRRAPRAAVTASKWELQPLRRDSIKGNHPETSPLNPQPGLQIQPELRNHKTNLTGIYTTHWLSLQLAGFLLHFIPVFIMLLLVHSLSTLNFVAPSQSQDSQVRTDAYNLVPHSPARSGDDKKPSEIMILSPRPPPNSKLYTLSLSSKVQYTLAPSSDSS